MCICERHSEWQLYLNYIETKYINVCPILLFNGFYNSFSILLTLSLIAVYIFGKCILLRTFVMGYGTAPAERLSMFVLIVACIGLGIPLALLIGGGCYMCIKRVRNR